MPVGANNGGGIVTTAFNRGHVAASVGYRSQTTCDVVCKSIQDGICPGILCAQVPPMGIEDVDFIPRFIRNHDVTTSEIGKNHGDLTNTVADQIGNDQFSIRPKSKTVRGTQVDLVTGSGFAIEDKTVPTRNRGNESARTDPPNPVAAGIADVKAAVRSEGQSSRRPDRCLSCGCPVPTRLTEPAKVAITCNRGNDPIGSDAPDSVVEFICKIYC